MRAVLFFIVALLALPSQAELITGRVVHVTDAISLFLFLFQGGPPPRPPYPLAGEDPSPDELSCGS